MKDEQVEIIYFNASDLKKKAFFLLLKIFVFSKFFPIKNMKKHTFHANPQLNLFR